jgi:hypothetical protein
LRSRVKKNKISNKKNLFGESFLFKKGIMMDLGRILEISCSFISSLVFDVANMLHGDNIKQFTSTKGIRPASQAWNNH